MTDGTSQGLFIVVAIVIFGIFVVLAYILFEDTLSPAMASMFTEATEQASERLSINLINPRTIRTNTQFSSELTLKNSAYRTIYNGHGSGLLSIHINNDIYELNEHYVVSGYLKLNNEPVTYSQWKYKRINNYSNSKTTSFHVDDATGYFEIAFQHIDNEQSIRLLHNQITHNDDSRAKNGDVFEIKQFTLKKSSK